MSLAELLKKGGLRGTATATPATVATDTPNIPSSVATVATVAVANAPDGAANDGAAPWRVSVAPGTPPDALARLRAASLALDAHIVAAGLLPGNDPDADCWPHSTAMNSAEIDTFAARLTRFTDQGLILADAERLADKLVIRDRDADSGRLCLECAHLRQAGGWRCGNWHQAGVATRVRDAQLPGALVQLLQRCHGFTDQGRPEGIPC